MASPYKFHFAKLGDKALPPTVFLHGFTGCSRDWRNIVAELASNFYCLMPDLPGHGQTVVEGSDDNFLMEHTASALIEWLDSLGVKQCHLAGYSMGGRLGLYLVLNYPDRFDKVVLESSSAGIKTEKERAVRRANDKSIAEKIITLSINEFMQEWYNQPLFATLRQHPKRLSALLKDRKSVDREGLAKSLCMMGTGMQPSLWRRLSEVQHDTLLIVGEKDTKFCKIAEEMAGLIQGVTVAVVTEAGHNVHFEKPDEFTALVKRFLIQ